MRGCHATIQPRVRLEISVVDLVATPHDAWLATDTVGGVLVFVLAVTELASLFCALVESSLCEPLVFVLILIEVIHNVISLVVYATHDRVTRYICHLNRRSKCRALQVFNNLVANLVQVFSGVGVVHVGGADIELIIRSEVLMQLVSVI